ncbi:MAG: hypothetical protein COV66_08255 [Nitrospinae bacterium CG11_big_fil_rev_8_21_14_0_20_45_15]|nr:MAG: hypothetical protein COV66_08255 [Nitrospinae bacterium CG11_big_fil_rev_8_21_14_0_20_45_15]
MNSFQIFHITGIFMLALVLGGMFFFAAIMTPLVFTKLPPQIAGPFIRETFPIYSQAMAGMTLMAAISLWNYSEVVPLIIVIVLFLWAWLWLTPKINRYRDAQLQGDPKAAKTFDRLHKLSVGIHLAQMVMIGIVLFRIVPSIG